MTALLYVGIALLWLGQLWCAKAALARGVGLGLVVLVVPFASLVLAYKYWEEARAALALNLLGLLLGGAAAASISLDRQAAQADARKAAKSASPAALEEQPLRAGLLKTCREATPTPGVCECITDRLVEHYPGDELNRVVKDHEQTGSWRDGYEDFVSVSKTLCSAVALPQTVDGGAPAVAGDPGPTSNPFDWVSASYDGRAVLKQTLLKAHSCAVSCSTGDHEVWKATLDCIATGRDFRFVSVDCERVVVVHNVRVDGTGWKTIVVATVYSRGKKAYDVGAVTVVKDPRRVDASPTWLQGVLGGAGEPPRYAKDGATVEIDCVDGKHSQIPLVVADDAQAPAKEDKAPAPVPKKKKRKR